MSGPAPAPHACIFVQFVNGLIWGPTDPAHIHLCNTAAALNRLRLHCQRCDMLTYLVSYTEDVAWLPERKEVWLPIIRGLSCDLRPACRHWAPIPAVTIPRNRNV